MKRPTQIDVARLAGVSRATVSYVLNGLTDGPISITEETRRRVLKAIDELGYQPDAMAQSLRSGTTNTIGLLLPDMHNPHYWQIASGVEQEAQSEGYDLLLNSTSLDPDRELHSLRALSRRRIDGLILLLTFAEGVNDEIEQLVERRKPLVMMNGGLANIPGIDVAATSYYPGAMELMNYLLSLGHQRIGFIFGVAHDKMGLDRLSAYQEALQSADLPYDENLIEACGTTLEEGYLAAGRLLDRSPHPTALVVINDLLAIGALRAVAERGLRVPQDISIASFDDIDLASYVNPPLTTVRMDAEELGRMSARLVFTRLVNPKLAPQKIHIPSRLVIRSSTGPVSKR